MSVYSRALLTDKQAAKYRRAYAAGEVSVGDIVAITHASRPTIAGMLRGVSYKYAGGPLSKGKLRYAITVKENK